jgi:uncharacterized membrane protein (Fun14 family)
MVEYILRLWRAIVVFNRAIGHGRTLETFLATCALIFGIILLLPGGMTQSHALHIVEVLVPIQILSIPWLCYAAIGMTGVLGNILGFEWSRGMRLYNTALGITLWNWLLLVTVQGYVTADGPLSMLALALPAGIFSKRVWWLAYNRLPPVGYPGLWV